MYAAVPRIIPGCVPAAPIVVESMAASDTPVPSGSSAFARPKSMTLTVPSVRTFTFAGFRSRWTMPRSCALSSASAIWRAIGSTSASGMGPRDTRDVRSSPATSSMTRTVPCPELVERTSTP